MTRYELSGPGHTATGESVTEVLSLLDVPDDVRAAFLADATPRRIGLWRLVTFDDPIEEHGL